MQDRNNFVDLLKFLIRQPSVVGAEHSFFRVLQRELEERGAHVTWYQGLLVARGKQPDLVMFSTHIGDISAVVAQHCGNGVYGQQPRFLLRSIL